MAALGSVHHLPSHLFAIRGDSPPHNWSCDYLAALGGDRTDFRFDDQGLYLASSRPVAIALAGGLWFPDTGATNHATLDVSTLSFTTSYDGPDVLWVGNGSEWIANIGDGEIQGKTIGCENITIPEENLLKCSGDPIATIVESTYPLSSNIFYDPTYLEKRAILAPTLNVVDSINEYMTSLNTYEGNTYFSFDSTCKSDSNVDLLVDVHTPEFLNGIKCSGVSNGTRMVITKLGNHVLEAKVLSGSSVDHKILIPRMSLTPSDLRLPFKFQRRQFPLIVSYAMTINKSKGRSLSQVGLFLKIPVVSHEQLYVAASKVTNPNALKILICDEENIQT
ncbi:uncharacterized protein LOC116005723 [Ipomoea triloba]|uniref:uncharacterized protein LOC116005723 n=1 Tax=Ipomoea triloba TaxID=35885 RepID=UPI00125CDEEC|nr:uncharacterized protein LOC116005723 [Ipomoea triloba]